MSASETSLILPDAQVTMREALMAGMDREDAIRQMRALGMNQIQCIKLLRDTLGISLGDAKAAVHCSAAWADRRESNEVLHEAAFSAAKELGYL